jgi:hypothetical protein
MAVNSVIVLKTLAGLKDRKGGILCISLVEKYMVYLIKQLNVIVKIMIKLERNTCVIFKLNSSVKHSCTSRVCSKYA